MVSNTGFVDASDRPDGDLVKEVYSHFGLCMYLAQSLSGKFMKEPSNV